MKKLCISLILLSVVVSSVSDYKTNRSNDIGVFCRNHIERNVL